MDCVSREVILGTSCKLGGLLENSVLYLIADSDGVVDMLCCSQYSAVAFLDGTDTASDKIPGDWGR